MSEPNPPRRPLATFLHPADAARDVVDGPSSGDTPPIRDASETESAVAAGQVAAPAPATISEPVRSAAAARASTAEPVFLRGPVHSLRAPRWQWATVAALAILLLLQIALADRARLAAEAATRPWVTTLCEVLRCALPAWHEPAAFTMTSREVRPVPGQAGALQVQASIRNDARWAQDWPTLKLSLSDADGRVIGTGVFTATDYLGGEAKTAMPLEPGQSAQIAFRVKEPAASTVAFNFEFL